MKQTRTMVTDLLQSLFYFIFYWIFGNAPAGSETMGADHPEMTSLCHPCVSVSPSEDAPHIHRLLTRLLLQFL